MPYGGGTDLMVSPVEDTNYLFLNKIPELKEIKATDEGLSIGAACTYTSLLESDLVPALLKAAVSQIAAPAIRNLGTPGGNICNGSPKGDSALIFFVLDAKLRLKSAIAERVVPIEAFYLGRQKTVLKADELLTEIIIPIKNYSNDYYEKIGARKALAISRVSFAGTMNVVDGTIESCRTAFGAVKDTIISRKDIDQMLVGKSLVEARHIKDVYLAMYDEEIVPLKGRVSAEYRKSVCMNLLNDFLKENGI